MAVESVILPRLLKEGEAARYLGLSTEGLRKAGIPRKIAGPRRFVYDRYDLDSFADGLPVEGGRGDRTAADEWFDEGQS